MWGGGMMKTESTSPRPGVVADNGDDELLLRLRSGDQQAYVSLWKRHVNAALRVANKISPTRAEDLVSESFLAVYEQVTTTGTGPTSAFRAYLFTVMRNMAMQWSKEAGRIDLVEEIEQIDLNDGLLLLERDDVAADLLAAFQELPDRWQRLLWLVEVERIARPKIAAEFGVRPNAVSSLQRRARAGLRLQWLRQQIPEDLRDDPSHVAGLLPSFVLKQATSEEALEVTTHVSDCVTCADVYQALQPLAMRMRKTTLLGSGFGALVVVLPAASPFTAPTVVAAVLVAGAATGVGLSGGMATGGIGALAIGGILAMSLILGVPGAISDRNASTESTQQIKPEANDESNPQIRGSELPDTAPPGDVEEPPPAREIQTGRHNTDKTIDTLDFSRDPNFDNPTIPDTPRVAPPGIVPDPDPSEESLTSGIVTPSTHSEYLAPVLTGRTAPDAHVAVKTLDNGNVFLADVDDDGAWKFDLRPLALPAGTHEYLVWAYTDTAQSPEELGRYTLLSPIVQGFEENPTLDIAEAKSTGIVMKISGPAGGVICLDSMMGQSALINLDAAGETTLRLRMFSHGFYAFSFRACTGGYRGAVTESFVTVDDPSVLFEPWGPDPDGMTFDISEM